MPKNDPSSNSSRAPRFKFLLYVADDTNNSALAIANLTTMCQENLAGRHEIEVVDIFKEPARAMADRVLMTPLLIRLAPSPVQRITGTLNQPGEVRQALGLEPLAS